MKEEQDLYKEMDRLREENKALKNKIEQMKWEYGEKIIQEFNKKRRINSLLYALEKGCNLYPYICLSDFNFHNQYKETLQQKLKIKVGKELFEEMDIVVIGYYLKRNKSFLKSKNIVSIRVSCLSQIFPKHRIPKLIFYHKDKEKEVKRLIKIENDKDIAKKRRKLDKRIKNMIEKIEELKELK